MSGGFGAVFDDLHQTASRIGDVVTGVEGLSWDGPSGEYGNADVQAGWAQFVENARAHVEGLRGRAAEHGDLVRSAAGEYQLSDDESERTLGRLGGGISALLNP